MSSRPLAVCVGIGVAMLASVQISRHNRKLWKPFQRSNSTIIRRRPSKTPSSSLPSDNPFIKETIQPKFLDCVQQLQTIDPSRRSKKHSISVVQFNILARNLATRNHFPYVAESSLNWNVRKRTLLRQLEELDADVVCLEELSDYWTFFKPELLERGYDSVYMKRPSIHLSTWSGEKKQDGCGIFYKKDKFELKECECINFHDAHDRIAVLALLQLREDTQLVLIGCTHLWWNAKRVDHQMAELFELEEEVIRMSCDTQDKYDTFMSESITGRHHVPIILCGDFNNSPDSPLYEYMNHSFMQKPNVEGAQEPFASAYAYYQDQLGIKEEKEEKKKEPPHTTVNFRRCWTIDYIWYSQLSLVPIRVLEIPSEAILRSEEGPSDWFNRLAMEDGYSRSGRLPIGLQGNHNGIPNSQFGSDHVPIMAEFQFIRPESSSSVVVE